MSFFEEVFGDGDLVIRKELLKWYMLKEIDDVEDFQDEMDVAEKIDEYLNDEITLGELKEAGKKLMKGSFFNDIIKTAHKIDSGDRNVYNYLGLEEEVERLREGTVRAAGVFYLIDSKLKELGVSIKEVEAEESDADEESILEAFLETNPQLLVKEDEQSEPDKRGWDSLPSLEEIEEEGFVHSWGKFSEEGLTMDEAITILEEDN